MRRPLQSFLVAALLVTLSTGVAAANNGVGLQPPVNTSLPVISGAAVSGATLTGSAGTWTGVSLTYSYGWARCESTGAGCAVVPGQTAATYRLGAVDVGKTLRFVVTASNKNGSAVATSAASAVVSAPPSTTTATTTTTTATTPTVTTTATTTTAATTTAAADPAFYRAVDVGGGGVTIDGRAWEPTSAPNLRIGPRLWGNQTIALVPATDPARASMIRSSAHGSTLTEVSLLAVPAATYDVYVTVWEDNYSATFDVKLEGAIVRAGYRSGSAGAWARLGPFRATVSDGSIDLTAGPDANVSGIEVWRVGSGSTTTTSTTTTTTTTGSTTTTTTPTSTSRWFAANSPWNTPIASNPVIATNSARWVNDLYAGIGNININQGSWTPPVYYATATTPRYRLVASNGTGWVIDNVPLPANFAPSSDSDGQVAIIDGDRVYEFQRVGKNSSGVWATFGAANMTRLNGAGFWNGLYCFNYLCGPWGARASGGSLLGGLIRPEDAKAGTVPHAIACAAPQWLIANNSRRGESPTMTSDGTGDLTRMPMGTRFQLDPTLNVSTLGLQAGEEMVARAMQVYGLYIIESTGSSLACFAQNVSNLGLNPYPVSWSTGITKELVRRMRVVAPPPRPVYDDRTTFGQPHK